MHPVGPLNSRVYWIRRVSIVVLAVALLIGMVWFLASRTSRSSAGAGPAAAADTSAAPTLTGVLAASSEAARMAVSSPSPSASASAVTGSGVSGSVTTSQSGTAVPKSAVAAPTAKARPPATTTASVSTKPASTKPVASTTPKKPPPTTKAAAPTAAAPTSKAAAPTTTKPPAPFYDAQGRLICPDSAIKVTAISTAPSFAVGSQPRLGMTVTNTGSQACQRDVSGTLQVLTVRSAKGTRLWSTTDCFPGEGTEVRELAPGQTVQYTIKWSGTTSAPGCTGQRAPVPAGDYRVVASLGQLSSPPAPFIVTP